MNTQLNTKQQSIAEFLSSPVIQKNIESVVGERKQQFITSVASLVNSNEALQRVDRKSLFAACLVAASLDLPINPNLGFAYIIPYKDQAQFQMGYKGFIQLAMRSGQFQTLNVTDVREGEIVANNRLSGEIEFTWLDDRDDLAVVGYVAYMRLTNGFEKSLYMTTKELTKHGMKFSQSMKKGFGLWKDDFNSMAKKTVIKMLLSKYAPMTTQMQTATLADQAVIEDDKYKYLDNEPIHPEEVATEKEQLRIIKHIQGSKSIQDLELCREAVESLSTKDEAYKMFSAKFDALANIK